MCAEIAQGAALQVDDRIGRSSLPAATGGAAVDALHVDRDLVAAFDPGFVIVVK